MTLMFRRAALTGAAVLSLIAGFLIVGANQVLGDGIGVFPTSIKFGDTLRGGEYFRTIGVINTSETEREFAFTATGDVSDWITFVNKEDRTLLIESVVAPPGGEGRALLKLEIPDDAANGTYFGVVKVLARVGEAQGNGSSAGVNLGAELSVGVIVSGTQNIAGELVDVSTLTQVEQGSPLRFKSSVRNSGNVRIEPLVNLDILDAAGNLVDHESFESDQVVFPGEIQDLVTEWDTSDIELGDYSAHISIIFEDVDLGARSTNFSVLEIGALTLGGDLRNIKLATEPIPNSVLKLKANFRNTGQRDALAKFIGELYMGTRLVKSIDNDGILVPVGEQKTLVAFTDIGEAGEYTIKGWVNYGVGDRRQETELQELSFTVKNPVPVEEVVDAVASSQGSVSENAGSSEASLNADEEAVKDNELAQPSTENSSKSLGNTLAIVIGGVAVIGILSGFGFLIIRRVKSKRTSENLLTNVPADYPR